jgi:hypothetical protein
VPLQLAFSWYIRQPIRCDRRRSSADSAYKTNQVGTTQSFSYSLLRKQPSTPTPTQLLLLPGSWYIARRSKARKKQNNRKPTEGRKLVLKQKSEGAAIKNRKGSSWGRWVYTTGIGG